MVIHCKMSFTHPNRTTVSLHNTTLAKLDTVSPFGTRNEKVAFVLDEYFKMKAQLKELRKRGLITEED